MSYVDDADFNPYAAPKAAPGPYGAAVLSDLTVEYAGFWIRFAALMIDSVVLGVVSLIVMFALIFAMVAINLDPVIAYVVIYLVSIIIQIGYAPLMHSSERQATYGKMAMGIKVTDLGGRRIGFGRALGREFAKILSALIFMIGYIMAGFTERKQALHDMIASTLVVRSH